MVLDSIHQPDFTQEKQKRRPVKDPAALLL